MDLQEETAKTKGKLYAMTILAVVGVLIVVILSIENFTSQMGKTLTEQTYYYVEINDPNRTEIMNLLVAEKGSDEQFYCDTMYKIEYVAMFPDGTFYTIYCQEQPNINFSIDKVGDDSLKDYIYHNGKMEKR